MSLRTADVTSGSTVDVLVRDLRGRILDGSLLPGARLVERDLTATYDVARHTLRAALRVLAGDGLVELVANRGAQVRAPDVGELRGLFELRTALECEAAHLALRRDPAGLADALRGAAVALSAVCRGPSPAWRDVADAHATMHRTIVDHAQSPRLATAYASLEGELRLLLVALRPVWALERMATHHEELSRDLLGRGVDALREHLADGAVAVLNGG